MRSCVCACVRMYVIALLRRCELSDQHVVDDQIPCLQEFLLKSAPSLRKAKFKAGAALLDYLEEVLGLFLQAHLCIRGGCMLILVDAFLSGWETMLCVFRSCGLDISLACPLFL